MKTYKVLLALVLIGIMSSCKMQGHHNFTKQKFTNLKSIKTVKKAGVVEDEIAENPSHKEDEVLNSSNSTNGSLSPQVVINKNKGGCDHIVLDDGSVLEVSVQRVSIGKLWYTKCGESTSSELFSLQRVLINRIEYSDEASRTTNIIVNTGSTDQQIIRGIEERHSFVVKLRDEKFLLENPRYDGIYGTVTGTLVAIEELSDTASVKVEFTADRYEEGANNKIEIWTKSIQDFSVSAIEKKAVPTDKPIIVQADQKSGTEINTVQVPMNFEDKSNSEDEWNEKSIAHNKKIVIKRNKDKSGTAFGAVWLFFLLGLLSFAVLFASIVAGLIMLAIAIIGIYVSLVSAAVFSRRYNKGRKELGWRRDSKNGLLTVFTWFFLGLISIPLLGIPLALAILISYSEGNKNY